MKSINGILFVSSYPPRECGIATYTQDLMNAIEQKFNNSFSLSVCALETKNADREYPDKVKYILRSGNSSEYIGTAEKINNDKNICLVYIQHEFGLYEGQLGENFLYFLYMLNKPVIIAFHTVIPDPDEKRKKIIQAIIMAVDNIVVMTNNSSKILINEYGIAPEKISVIQHGTHLVNTTDRNSIKKSYSLEDKWILSTFGLLNSGKCIETALDALPPVIKKFPNVIYQVIGKTHPEVIEHEGEKYRNFLESKVKTLGIGKHVKFINRYLSLEDLLEQLQLTDIYLFTSKDPNQAVSGTFSYAMGCSCAVISTPIPPAMEMLNGNAGIIVDFQDPEQLATAIIELLSNPLLRKQISLNALHRISPTAWENSAVLHAELFKKTLKNKISLIYSAPEISLDHFKRMTTNIGFIQFAEVSTPDLNSGYTLDDNARALIAITKHYEMTGDETDKSFVDIYLNFIKFSQLPDGKFLNYVDKYGKHSEKNKHVNLEDSMGRAVWALGEFINRGKLFHCYFSRKAESLIKKSLVQVERFESPRAIAFAIKGLFHYNEKMQDKDISFLISQLADKLVSGYTKLSGADWKWFEEYLTYANSVLPEALLYAFRETGNELYKNIAKTSFDFLLSLTFIEKEIKVVSNNGWHKRGDIKKHFGEQPIDVAYTISSLDLFYEIFGDNSYLKKIEIAFSWFHGNNHLHQIIYNPATCGCQDGLEETNVNLNQGAESTICYLMARIIMEKYFKKRREDEALEVELIYEPIVTEINNNWM